MNKASRIGILVIGCGSIGQRHIRSFLKTGEATLYGCELDPHKRREVMNTFNIDCYSDVEDALTPSEIQAVVIATPAPSHIKIAINAARRRKHVLIEKPMALEMTGIPELSRLAEASSLCVAVAYVYRFRKIFSIVREFLETSDYGRPLMAILKGGQPFDEKRPGYEKTYFASHQSGGGVIQDGLCHYSDLLSWLVGRCNRLTAHAVHSCLAHVDVEDTVTLLGQYGRTQACIHMNLFQAPTEFLMELHCEYGSIKVEFHHSRWGCFRKGDADWTWHTVEPESSDDPYVAQARAFLDLIHNRSSIIASLEDGIEQIQVIQTALEITSKNSALQPIARSNWKDNEPTKPEKIN